MEEDKGKTIDEATLCLGDVLDSRVVVGLASLISSLGMFANGATM